MKKSLIIVLVFALLFPITSLAATLETTFAPNDEDVLKVANYYDVLNAVGIPTINREYSISDGVNATGQQTEVFSYPIVQGAVFFLTYLDEEIFSYTLVINPSAVSKAIAILLFFGPSFTNISKERSYDILSFLVENKTSDDNGGESCGITFDDYCYLESWSETGILSYYIYPLSFYQQ